jgi:bacteriocin-like protein
MKKLEINEMSNIQGGTNWLAFGCGAGVALSIFTGGIGALVFGPSTAGICIAAASS